MMTYEGEVNGGRKGERDRQTEREAEKQKKKILTEKKIEVVKLKFMLPWETSLYFRNKKTKNFMKTERRKIARTGRWRVEDESRQQ